MCVCLCVPGQISQIFPSYRFFLPAVLQFSKSSDFFTRSSEHSELEFTIKGVGVQKSPVAGKVGLMAVCKPPRTSAVFITWKSHPPQESSCPHPVLLDHLLPLPPTTIIYLLLIPPLMLQTLIPMSQCWVKCCKPQYYMLIYTIVGNSFSASVKWG